MTQQVSVVSRGSKWRENPLHRGEVGAAHEEKRRRRGRWGGTGSAGLPRRPDFHLAARTAAELVILLGLDVAASLTCSDTCAASFPTIPAR